MHPLYPFLAASPDRIIEFKSGKGYVVEVKCPFGAFQEQISHETVDYLELESGKQTQNVILLSDPRPIGLLSNVRSPISNLYRAYQSD